MPVACRRLRSPARAAAFSRLPALLLLAAASASLAAAASVAAATDAFVQWRGRYRQDTLAGTAAFDWEGVQFRVQVVNATRVSANVAIPVGITSRLRVLINGSSVGVLTATAATPVLTLATGLAAAYTHEVNTYNMIEPALARGMPARAARLAPPSSAATPAPTLLSVVTDGAFVEPSSMRPIKIMTIGDSITSGFGAAGAPCTGGALAWTDHSSSFTPQLCAHFAAECLATVAWAGKGLILNSPSSAGKPAMPAYMTQVLGGSEGSRDVDFNRPSRPDVILVNLGDNDMGTPAEHRQDNATFVAEFVAAYVELARNLTAVYFSGFPTLFLAVGPITRSYEAPVLAAISAMHARLNITAHFVNLTGAPLDGCDGHPGPAGHAAMAATYAAAISAVMGWKAGEGASPARQRAPAPRLAAPAAIDRAALWAARSAAVLPRGWSRPTALAGGMRRAAGAASPAPISLTVRSDGTGDFTSIQAALDSCNASSGGAAGHVTLNILGRFRERVVVAAAFSGGVTLLGAGATALDALLVFNVSNARNVGTFNTHTLLVQAADVTLVNIAVANDAAGFNAAAAGQSVALHIDATADRFACIGCALLGSQDTAYTGCAGYGLRSFFYDMYINGTCDSLFGGSSSVFEASVLDISFTVTAARGEPASAYLLLDSAVAPNGDTATVLARPWGQRSTTVARNCHLGAGLAGRGWDDWGNKCTTAPPPHDVNATWCAPLFYAEANSTGPGASGARVWWARQLDAADAARWTRDAVLRGWQPLAALRSGEAADALARRYPGGAAGEA